MDDDRSGTDVVIADACSWYETRTPTAIKGRSSARQLSSKPRLFARLLCGFLDPDR